MANDEDRTNLKIAFACRTGRTTLFVLLETG
jgi:hypothetical protein